MASDDAATLGVDIGNACPVRTGLWVTLATGLVTGGVWIGVRAGLCARFEDPETECEDRWIGTRSSTLSCEPGVWRI